MIEDLWALVKSQALSKMVNALLNLKIQIFPLYGHHFDCPGSESVFPVRIQIPGSHINTDPHGTGSGSETLIKRIID